MFVSSSRKVLVCAGMILAAAGLEGQTPLSPSSMPRLASVDERFQSYNVEMLEVTGGNFWKPYASMGKKDSGQAAGSAPAGMLANLFEYRAPKDLSNGRLQRLAAALGPAYLRVSGTWANTTYFQDTPGPAMEKPPQGFNGVLTREEWKGVVDFARAANAKLVTSVAISSGARNADGAWTPVQARKVFSYTKSMGGEIAAAEFMNEPTIPVIGGAPKGYDAKSYAADVREFRAFLKANSPETILAGPGSTAEGGASPMTGPGFLSSEALLQAVGPVFDVFSFHVYPVVSVRCARLGAGATTTADAALTPEFLARPAGIEAFCADLRNRFEPGKPLWITETAESACGGDPWASTFLDSFRYLNQLGTMARLGVQVTMHNTLASSDYGLLDEKTYEPRPDYWSALLWRKLMGTTVLDPGASPLPNLHLYAHCLRGSAGGVALLAINADKEASASLALPAASERYTLSARELQSKTVDLNGSELKLGSGDALPALRGVQTPKGAVVFAPETISFLAIGGAQNSVCQR
jgi:heparanase 1